MSSSKSRMTTAIRFPEAVHERLKTAADERDLVVYHDDLRVQRGAGRARRGRPVQAERVAPARTTKLPPARPGGTGQQLAEFEFSSTAWTGKTIVIAARVIGSSRRAPRASGEIDRALSDTRKA